MPQVELHESTTTGRTWRSVSLAASTVGVTIGGGTIKNKKWPVAKPLDGRALAATGLSGILAGLKMPDALVAVTAS